MQPFGPKDSVANHGAGVGALVADVSIIEDSYFDHLQGLRWGGAMLSYSPYGGILDDGGQASPLYVDCAFDHGTALHGSGFYSYGSLSE